MALRRPGDKPLSEPIVLILLMHICVARPQWVEARQNRDHFPIKKVYCISWLTSCTSKFHSDVFAMISLWISSEEAAKLTVQLPVIWDVLRLLWQVSPWHMAFGNQRAIYTVTWLMVILTSSVVLEKHLVTCPYITQWRHYIDPWKYNNEVGIVILSNLREVDFSDVWHKEAFGSIKSCLFENGQLHWNWKKMTCWRNFPHWLHWRLSFWQLAVQPLRKSPQTDDISMLYSCFLNI